MEGPEKEISNVDIAEGSFFSMHGNFKVFARAILALNRIGEELYVEPSELGLALRALNCSKSAFGMFLFSKTFFSSCDVSRLTDNAYNTCRVSMKGALSAFKCVKNCQKVVLSCQLYINPQADAMKIQLKNTDDVTRSYEIPFFDCSTSFRHVVDKTTMSNCCVIKAKSMLEVFNRMYYETDEIIIDAKPEEILFKNFITREKDKDTVLKMEGKIALSEFQKYSIQRPTEIAVNLKELKAIVNFADNHQSSISMYFEYPGKPLIIALEDDVSFTAEVVLATVMDGTCDTEYEIPIQTIHHGQPVDQQRTQIHSQSPQNSYLSLENLMTGYDPIERKRAQASSDCEGNDAGLQNVIKSVNSASKSFQGTSSILSDSRTFSKQIRNELLPINSTMENNFTVADNNAVETSTADDFAESEESSGSEKPPSCGPALFRFLFAIDERTFDEEEYFRDAKVLAPDSDPEENYDFFAPDFEHETNYN